MKHYRKTLFCEGYKRKGLKILSLPKTCGNSSTLQILYEVLQVCTAEYCAPCACAWDSDRGCKCHFMSQARGSPHHKLKCLQGNALIMDCLSLHSLQRSSRRMVQQLNGEAIITLDWKFSQQWTREEKNCTDHKGNPTP